MSADPSPDSDAVADLLAKAKAARAARRSGGVIEGLSARERRLLERLIEAEPALMAAVGAQR